VDELQTTLQQADQQAVLWSREKSSAGSVDRYLQQHRQISYAFVLFT
jgi:hypothetical protein